MQVVIVSGSANAPDVGVERPGIVSVHAAPRLRPQEDADPARGIGILHDGHRLHRSSGRPGDRETQHGQFGGCRHHHRVIGAVQGEGSHTWPGANKVPPWSVPSWPPRASRPSPSPGHHATSPARSRQNHCGGQLLSTVTVKLHWVVWPLPKAQQSTVVVPTGKPVRRTRCKGTRDRPDCSNSSRRH